MAGIYIHIPFCKQACHYCNFHFSTSTSLRKEMIAALIKEVSISRNFLFNGKNDEEIIETIYFGGGTPSLLLDSDIKNIFSVIKNNYRVKDNAEVTLEANPDDINEKKLSAWKNMGINRLSIGIQSLHERDLKWMNRGHNAKQAKESIQFAQRAGFENISVDLIYGVPNLNSVEWELNIDFVIETNIPHIACYALTVEPRTALQKMIEKRKKENVDLEMQAVQFELAMKKLKVAGYEHYEISNFAKKNYRSKHNSSYWQGKKYIGIGPSAHSYDGVYRRWNIANNALYIESIKNNIPAYEEEKLSFENKINEYVMTSLRTQEGLHLDKIANDFSIHERERIIDIINKKNYIHLGLIIQEQENIFLTDKGKLFADGIAAELFKI